MAGKKQAPAKVEDEDETEGWDEAVVDSEKESEADLRMRDWRDVERFREMKELRKLVDDDYGLEEIFHIPVKPRAEPGIPASRGAKPGKALLPEKPGQKGAPAPAAGKAAVAHVKGGAPTAKPGKPAGAALAPGKSHAVVPAKAQAPHARPAANHGHHGHAHAAPAKSAPKKPVAKLSAKAKRK